MTNTITSEPCVYVFHPSGDVERPIVIPFQICRSVREANAIALRIRQVFRCPVWIEDFKRSANVQTCKIRHESVVPRAVSAT